MSDMLELIKNSRGTLAAGSGRVMAVYVSGYHGTYADFNEAEGVIYGAGSSNASDCTNSAVSTDDGALVSGSAIGHMPCNNNEPWHCVSGTLGSGDDLGNHTATQNLDMNSHNVNNAAGYFHGSDRRLKTNIVPVSGLAILEHLTGVSFNWKDSGRPSTGVIAQDVEKVMPQAVMTEKKTGMKEVDYDQIIAPLIQATKELDAKVKALDEDNRALREEMRDLKQRQPQGAGSR